MVEEGGGGGSWGGGRKARGGRGEDQYFGVWGEHPDTRAESMISTHLVQMLAAERTDGLPWVDLGVGGWPAERRGGEGWGPKMQPLRQKVRPKCDPFVRNRCHNACLLALQQSFGSISGAENRTP